VGAIGGKRSGTNESDLDKKTSVTVDHFTTFVCEHCGCEVGSLEISEHLWACDGAINAGGDSESDTDEDSEGEFDDAVHLNTI